MPSTRTVLAAACACAALAACTPEPSRAPTHDADGHVLVTVALYQGTSAQDAAALRAAADAFERAHPDVRVTLQDYTFTAQTFAAEAAGGTLPTVFFAPFADARALIEDGQVADVGPLVSRLPYADGAGDDDLAPALLDVARGPRGLPEVVPVAVAPVRLWYHRGLFARAGLDAGRAPGTWDEVAADARAVADRTGAAGLVVPSNGGAGGAQLAALAAARGGALERSGGARADATVDTPPVHAVAGMVQELCEAGALGPDPLGDADDAVRRLAAGKAAMIVSSDDVASAAHRYGLAADELGSVPVPLEGAGAGALVDGTVAAVSPRADAAQREAAVALIDEVLVRAGSATLPAALTGRQESGGDSGAPPPWVAPPLTATRAVYGALDPAVQVLLTRCDADVDELLADAQDRAATTLRRS